MLRKLFALCVLCVLAATCAHASSSVILTDQYGPNSTVKINTTGGAGLTEWSVLGTNLVQHNWWYYRIGGTGAVSAIDTIAAPTVSQSPSTPYLATITYAGASLTFAVTYMLTGADNHSGTSDLSQTVVVTNKTGSALDLHLFELMNYDLYGTPNNDTVWRETSGNIYQKDGVNTSTVCQIGSNNAKLWEIGSADSLRSKLADPSFKSLGNVGSPYTGDAAWALQWDMTTGSGSASEDLQVNGVVPEPGSLVSLSAGLLGLVAAIRRRRS